MQGQIGLATQRVPTCAQEWHSSNPFSTRCVRPGAIPYRFPSGLDAAQLVEQLRAHGWRGAILGPHGSGKTTLLVTLFSQIERAGRAVKFVALHDRECALPASFLQRIRRDSPGLAVVDGYEQLGWWSRRRLCSACRRHDCGLLVTAHSDSAARQLPVIFRTAADLATVRRLVNDLLASHRGMIERADVAAAFQAQRGNVREMLFALYDLFESRRRDGNH